MILYNICFSDLVPLVWSSLDPSVLLQMALFPSSWWLSNTANTFLSWLVLCAVPAFPAVVWAGPMPLQKASLGTVCLFAHTVPWWHGPWCTLLAGRWVGLTPTHSLGEWDYHLAFREMQWWFPILQPGFESWLCGHTQEVSFSKLGFFHLGKDMIHLIKLEWNLRHLFYM